MENNTFSYSYSAKRNKEIESIRQRYIPKEEDKLQTLKRLDGRVSRAGTIEGICVGVVGALIFGVGMCFGLDVFAGEKWMTLALCGLGAAIMIPAYPIYKGISRRTRARLTPEILRLSDELMN